MSANSSIEWTDHTFNPWWGCVKVSAGCEHCYAELLSNRYGHKVWGPEKTTQRRTFGDGHWREPVTWNESAEREGKRQRVFCASMADVFESNAGVVDARIRLFDLIEATPWLDWLLLTKRPELVRELLPTTWLAFPRANVWFGTSIEDQQRADERLPLLRAIPAAVRFLSSEPLLGPVSGLPLDGIAWVIVGGESGPGARRMDPEWARSIRDQCRAAGTKFFFKQAGSVLAREWGMEGKGHDMTCVPVDLQAREFPTSLIAKSPVPAIAQVA